MRYSRNIVRGDNLETVIEALNIELRKIEMAMRQPEVDAIEFVTLNVEPIKRPDGITVKADGTNFNPGGGEGIYERRAGAWVKVG